MILKKGEICDPMEKILIQKELYFLSYEFMKFLTFLDFNLIFTDFILIIS